MDIDTAFSLNLNIYWTIKRLRDLVVCHDRAVQQMYLIGYLYDDMQEKDLAFALNFKGLSLEPYAFSGSRLADVVKRRRLHRVSSACFDDVSLSLRQEIMEGVLEAYTTYRLIKWKEIQILITAIFDSFDSEVVHFVLQTATLRRNFSFDGDAEDDSDFEDDSGNIDPVDIDLNAMWLEDSTDMRIQY